MIVPNSPASQAGLPAGLIIQKIDDVPTASKSLVECVNLIRGKAGTKVRLELVTSDGSKTNTMEITRENSRSSADNTSSPSTLAYSRDAGSASLFASNVESLAFYVESSPSFSLRF